LSLIDKFHKQMSL